MTNILSANFYEREVTQVARELLGKRLLSTVGNQRTAGLIVETEAYLAKGDSACHAARGATPSNSSMFGLAGRAYVYSIHSRYCFNTVAQQVGHGCAVLIRAIEPDDGIPAMMKRRQTEKIRELCRGPARLAEALGIDKRLDGHDLTIGSKIWIEKPGDQSITHSKIKVTERIGVTSAKQLLLRFVIEGNEFVSGPKRLR